MKTSVNWKNTWEPSPSLPEAEVSGLNLLSIKRKSKILAPSEEKQLMQQFFLYQELSSKTLNTMTKLIQLKIMLIKRLTLPSEDLAELHCNIGNKRVKLPLVPSC